MKQKWILILFLISSLFFSLAAAQAEKAYFARSYVTDVIVQSGGDLLITETVTFEFSGGPFTFVYREIPTDYTNGIDEITASMDGRMLSPGSQPGQYEIQPGNPTRVTWHFEETYNQVRSFSLEYRVAGAVRQTPDADLLEWNLLPTEYEYTIQSVEAAVIYPDNLRLLQPPVVLRGQAELESSPGIAVLNAADIGPDQPLHVALHFPPGSLIAAPPAWQTREADTASAMRSALPLGLLTGFATTVLGIILLAFWQKRAGQPDLQLPPAGDMPKQMSPPASLPPAYAGLLAKKSDQADWSNALGTLIDLSRRGWVQLVETQRGLFKSRTFEVHLLRDPENALELRQHEQGLIEMLFTHRNQRRTQINAQDLTNAVSRHFKKYTDPLRKEMEAEGWFNPKRRRARTLMYAVGLTLLLVGMIAAIALLVFTTTARGAGSVSGIHSGVILGAFFAGLGFTGAAGLIMATGLTPLADHVVQQAAQWKSFSVYLKDVTRNREPVVRPDLFEVYLPYAASFGLAEAWAKYFQKQGMQTAPAWFTAASPDNNMGAFIAIMGSTNSAGSAGSGGGAGGGGAGGGGGSGAG
jgi:hypothetical protein